MIKGRMIPRCHLGYPMDGPCVSAYHDYSHENWLKRNQWVENLSKEEREELLEPIDEPTHSTEEVTSKGES